MPQKCTLCLSNLWRCKLCLLPSSKVSLHHGQPEQWPGIRPWCQQCWCLPFRSDSCCQSPTDASIQSYVCHLVEPVVTSQTCIPAVRKAFTTQSAAHNRHTAVTVAFACCKKGKQCYLHSSTGPIKDIHDFKCHVCFLA